MIHRFDGYTEVIRGNLVYRMFSIRRPKDGERVSYWRAFDREGNLMSAKDYSTVNDAIAEMEKLQ